MRILLQLLHVRSAFYRIEESADCSLSSYHGGVELLLTASGHRSCRIVRRDV